METVTSTSTKSSLAAVKQGFTDFATGDFQSIINRCTDDVVWGSYKNPDVPISGFYYGKEGVHEFFFMLTKLVTLTEFEPKEFIAENENVVVLGRQKGTVNETGKTFEHDWAMAFKVDDGKIKRFFSYTDTRDQSLAFKELG